jgi:hypothetical protein
MTTTPESGDAATARLGNDATTATRTTHTVPALWRVRKSNARTIGVVAVAIAATTAAALALRAAREPSEPAASGAAAPALDVAPTRPLAAPTDVASAPATEPGVVALSALPMVGAPPAPAARPKAATTSGMRSRDPSLRATPAAPPPTSSASTPKASGESKSIPDLFKTRKPHAK